MLVNNRFGYWTTGRQHSFDFFPSRVSWNAVLGDYLQTWTGTMPTQATGVMIHYQIAAHITGTDQWVYADNQVQSAAHATRFSHWAAGAPTPSWSRAATIYHIFVDRFNPGYGRSWNKTNACFCVDVRQCKMCSMIVNVFSLIMVLFLNCPR